LIQLKLILKVAITIHLHYDIYTLKTIENIDATITKQKPYRWLRRLLRTIAAILVFLFLVVLFIRSSWGQSIIVDTFVDYVEDKTKTKVAVDRLFVTFGGDIQLEGLYLEDKKGDTLVYSKLVEANIPLWATISGKAVGVDAVNWQTLRANITRSDTVSGYNFQFLVDAFAPADTVKVAANSTSAPLDVIIRSLKMQDFDVVFDDKVAGIDSRFKFGLLETRLKTTDVASMYFKASSIHLSDAKVKFIQTPINIDTTTTDTVLPKLVIDALSIKNTTAYYESQPNQLSTNLIVKDFYAKIPNINLTDSSFNFDVLRLKDSEIIVETKTNSNNDTTANLTKEDAIFKWPDITVEAANIDLKNNAFTYSANGEKPQLSQFNPNAISLQHINFQIQDVALKDELAGFNLKEFSFNSTSGYHLKELAMQFKASNTKMAFNGLRFQLNENGINGDGTLNYPSLNSLKEQPEQVGVELNLPNFNLSLKELFKFQPKLKDNPYQKTLSQRQFSGNIKASGTLANMALRNLKLNWGNTTRVLARGNLQHLTQPEQLKFNMMNIDAQTNRNDIIQFVKEEDLGISLPEKIALQGSVAGNTQNLVADATVITTQGTASISGNVKTTNTIAFDAELNVKQYNLKALLNNPQLGNLSLTLAASGSGSNINNLNAVLDVNISELGLQNYAITNLDIAGNIKSGEGKISSKYKDENINLGLEALVVLDSVAPRVSANMDVIGANLQALGVMQRNVKTGMNIRADFKGNTSSYNAEVQVEDGVVVYDNKTYLLGALSAQANVQQDTTSILVANKMLDLVLQSNTDPQTFSNAIKNHVSSYFTRANRTLDTLSKPVNLILEGKISQSQLLNDVFLVNVKDLDTIDISLNFNEKARRLKANVTAPHVNYSGNELDSIAFSLNSNKDDFNFNLGFKNITAGPLDIPKTIITGNQNNNELSLRFLGYHNGERLMNVNTKITGNSERLMLKVNTDSLILNAHKWTIPKTNEIILTAQNLAFTDFAISKDNQSIAITDKFKNINQNHVALDFKNFKISEIFNYLNPEAQIAMGRLDGNFILENPFAETGILANLNITDFKALNTDLGMLSLNGNSLAANNYAFNVGIKGGAVNLDLVGDYIAGKDDAELDLNLNINEFKIQALNTLALGEIKNGKGSASGKFKLKGSTKAPQYQGNITFNNAEFNVSKLNTPFKFKNETLQVNNKGVFMDNFTVRDINNNAMVISGDIRTENFLNPTFNLNLKATNFKLLNATEADNENFYGKASFSTKSKLTGDLRIPKLNADLVVSPDTDVVYVMPSAVANVEERDGVVTFVNRENPNAILTQTEPQTATIKGFDIKALLKTSKEALVTIIIDKETGDNFKVRGDGDFNFAMKPNGRLSLSGVYEIADGHYELNLYNLVNRKFDIAKGSRVVWSGDPFDAKLDVRAIYKLETSASSLMASITAGADPSVKNKYRQVLPFLVYLNIDGELLQPQISFNLDMPEEEQGAIGGQVFGRVQQVNSQETELNRQVFSLLVLNRFYPNPGSDGSAGGIASIARDNLNDAVSGQLNAFSDKILGKSGVELDFGLDSFTDYQGSAIQERTQLDIAAQKKLFNDRLIVRVGSEVDIQGRSAAGEATPIIGNVSLEYILSEDGRYRLKGFRRSEFENVIDGQTIVSGIGLIFTQEFNKFSELWDAILRSQSKKQDDEKQEAKTIQNAKMDKNGDKVEPKNNQ
jgi:hypothetical protein